MVWVKVTEFFLLRLSFDAVSISLRVLLRLRVDWEAPAGLGYDGGRGGGGGSSTHYSLHPNHCTLLTTHCSLLTAHYSLLTDRGVGVG